MKNGCMGLTFTPDTSDTKGYPVLTRSSACIACGFCADDCPVDGIEMYRPQAISSKL